MHVPRLGEWRILSETALKTNGGQGSDQDLDDVERVLAGDVEAFEGIVRRWQGPLVNMAWRYCRDRGRAEELAQEAFVRAWRGLAQWRREGSFSTWALRTGGQRVSFGVKAVSVGESAAGSGARAVKACGAAQRVGRAAKLRCCATGREGAAGSLSRGRHSVLFSRDGCGWRGADDANARRNGQGAVGKSKGTSAKALSAS
jgi:hypothetical protein